MFFESSLGELTVTVFPRILKKKKKYTPESFILPFTPGKLTRLFLLKKVKPPSSLQI